jgi:hypothetical protein
MEECPICLSPLSGNIVTTGCCKKQFHEGCHIKCLRECPLCRSKEHVIDIEPQQPQQIILVDKTNKPLLYCFGTIFVFYIIELLLSHP